MENNKINVKPEIDRLINIIELVKHGKLVVPGFQRDYIWDKKQRIDLFDSIKRGFPIGSLLFWNPELDDYEYNSNIGPYTINNVSPNKYSFIIDGYQRMTTLFCALINPCDESIHINNSKNLQDFTIYYDLENEEFTQLLYRTQEKYLIPLYKLIDTFSFLSFSEEIKSIYNEEKSSIYINRAKKLATTLTDYSLAYVFINGGTIQDSVEIFSRINSKGSDMSPMWMLSALTYDGDFKFSDEIERLQSELIEYNFEDLKTEIILQCIETSTGKIYFDVKTESLSKRKDFSDLCYSTFSSIKKAVSFLYNQLNVLNYKLLPYNLQLVFLTDFFRRVSNPNDQQLEDLTKWFWQTSYSNYFSIYSLSKQRKAFEKFQKYIDGKTDTLLYKATKNNFIVPEFPKNIYYGSVRSKTYALFLIKYALKDKYDLENNDLEDFYSLKPPSKDSEFMFPKFIHLDYKPKYKNSNSKKIKDYSFLLVGDTENFNYKNNFIPKELISDTFHLDDDPFTNRYYLIRDEEKRFVKSIGNLDYDYIDDRLPF